MLISTKGRYALRVLVDLAEQPADLFVPLKEIAQRQDISEKYLESILRILVRNNIVTGLRGKGGGYRLNPPPDTIMVGSILELTETSLSPVTCLDDANSPCPRKSQCRTLPMWIELDHIIHDFLHSKTIRDIMDEDIATIRGDHYCI